MVHYDRPGDDISRGLIGYWKLDDLKRVPADGIIAHYKMNDNAANTIVIDSKGGNNGTLNGGDNTSVVSSVGKINEAFTFNGIDDSVTIPNDNSLSSDNSFTVSLWANITAFPATGGFPTSNIISFLPSTLRGIGILAVNTDSEVKFVMRDDSESSDLTFVSSPTAGFHHYLVTYNAQTNTMEAFYDSSSQGTTTHSNIDLSTNNTIGGNNVVLGNSNFFNGLIDDVRIYNRVLSQSEIDTIYNSNTGTETTELFRDIVVAIDRANFNDGIINGCTNADGQNWNPTNSMSFDGVDDFVDIPEEVGPKNNDYTFSLWFKLNEDLADNTSTSLLTFISASLRGQGLTLQNPIGAGTTQIEHVMRDVGGSIKALIDVPTTIINKWIHVAATYNFSTNTQKLYIDGILKDTDSGKTIATIIDGSIQSNRVIIGNGVYANMLLSRVRIYNRTLTQGQVNKLHRLKL